MAESLLGEVSIIKFLGIMINNQLTWECHKQQIYNKVCRNLGIIYKCRAVMEEKEVIKMYKAFIQPYFLYGIEVWEHSVKSEKDNFKIAIQCIKCFKFEKFVHALCKDSKGEYLSTNHGTKTFLHSFSKRSEKSVTNFKKN